PRLRAIERNSGRLRSLHGRARGVLAATGAARRKQCGRAQPERTHRPRAQDVAARDLGHVLREPAWARPVSSCVMVGSAQTLAGWSWVSEQIAAVNVLATPTAPLLIEVVESSNASAIASALSPVSTRGS